MTDREKVMKGLECCIASDDDHECQEECPYYDACWSEGEIRGYVLLKKDALELLKAQEPRVLTLEEVEALEEGTIVWVEENYGGQRYLNPMVCNGHGFFGNFYLGIDINYWLCDGKKRFWNSKPTKEQSEATPWEPPKEVKA